MKKILYQAGCGGPCLSSQHLWGRVRRIMHSKLTWTTYTARLHTQQVGDHPGLHETLSQINSHNKIIIHVVTAGDPFLSVSHATSLSLWLMFAVFTHLAIPVPLEFSEAVAAIITL